jgi:hypothetical protein
LGIDLVDNPDLALNVLVSVRVFALYFQEHAIPDAARAGNWQQVRQAVNGGLNGWNTFYPTVEVLQATPDATLGAQLVHVTFSARTMAELTAPLGWYHQPTTHSARLGGYQKDQSATFAAWQLGEQQTDLEIHLPDRRWYMRADGAWTASAWWNQNAPDSIPL